MTKTTHFSMSLLAPNQAQKEITLNESLIIIDALLGGAVIDIGINYPPTDPKNGDLYIIGDEPTGNWENYRNYIAYFFQGWRYILPREGMGVWVIEKKKNFRIIDNQWVEGV